MPANHITYMIKAASNIKSQLSITRYKQTGNKIPLLDNPHLASSHRAHRKKKKSAKMYTQEKVRQRGVDSWRN